MTKKAFEKISEGLSEALSIVRGESRPARVKIPSKVDVKAIRKRLGLPQTAFADRFGFSLQQVRDWEQGRSEPLESARAYLIVIEREPKIVEQALNRTSKPKIA